MPYTHCMAKPIRHYGKWRIRWLNEAGERSSAVFDTFSEAKHRLSEYQVRAEEVRRGIRSSIVEKKTFAELCDYWLNNNALGKRSMKDDVSIISRHLLPAFGKLQITQVTVERVDRFKATLDHLQDKTKSNILTLLITLLNQAQRLRWLVEVPHIQKPKVKLFYKDFRYLKSSEEISRFLSAARTLGEFPFAIYSTAIYTGMREGELAGLRWSDIDFDRKIIAVQKSFKGPTKSGMPRYVPILDELVPILKEWRCHTVGEIVFPNQRGSIQHSTSHIFRSTFHRALEVAGFPVVLRGGKLRSYLVFHDLRHTFASYWMLNGGDIFRLQKIMGHQSIAMTLRYAHLAPDAFMTDYGRFKDIVTPPQKALL